MFTVGQINEKISLLRSKIAVTEGIVLYLKTHYIPSEGTSPEMSFTRVDYGKAPVDHIIATVGDYADYLDAIRAELHALENTPIMIPPVLAVPEKAEEPEVPEAKKTKNGGKTPKETSGGTPRRSQDQPPTDQPSGSRSAG